MKSRAGRKAGWYAHAQQYRRLGKAVKRQLKMLGVLTREGQGALKAEGCVAGSACWRRLS